MNVPLAMEDRMSSLPRTALLLLAAGVLGLSLIGCPSPVEVANDEPAVTDVDPGHLDDDPFPPDDDDSVPDVEICVKETFDAEAPPACPNQDSRECAEDYLDFAQVFAPSDGLALGDDWGSCRREMRAWVSTLDNVQRGDLPRSALSLADRRLMTPFDGTMAPGALASEVLDAMNLGVLLTDFDRSELNVTVRGMTRHEGTNGAGEVVLYEQTELVLCGPYVGCFDARLLMPLLPGPRPAIVAMTGHPLSDNVLDDFADTLSGRRYAVEGYAFLIVAFRAFDSSVVEDDAAVELLCAGSSLYAMHNLESLNAAKYLRWLRLQGVIDGIGFLGHSSGSVSGVALYRYLDQMFPGEFQGVVADSNSSYLQVNRCEGYPERVDRARCIIDETTPELFQWHWAMNNAMAHRYTLPYMLPEPCYAFECPGDVDNVLAFFDSTL